MDNWYCIIFRYIFCITTVHGFSGILQSYVRNKPAQHVFPRSVRFQQTSMKFDYYWYKYCQDSPYSSLNVATPYRPRKLYRRFTFVPHGHNRDTVVDKNTTQEASIPASYYAASLLVPAIWGAYSPVVKWLYSSPQIIQAPPPLLFTFFSYVVSLISLSIVRGVSRFNQETSRSNDSQLLIESKFHYFGSSSSPLSSNIAIAGLELGLWLFLGSTVQLIGIGYTTATRAAILVQLTTLLVPFIDSIVNRNKLSSVTWVACLTALVGVIFVSTNLEGLQLQLIAISSASVDTLIPSFQYLIASMNIGDLLVCLSAVFYSFHVVRLTGYSSLFPTTELAFYVNIAKLSFSIFSLAVSFVIIPGVILEYNQFISSFFAASDSAWVLIYIFIWNGVCSTALTSWCQTYCQQKLSSTTANLIYTMQPVWAGALSYFFLGERLTGNSLVGVSIVLLSVAIAITGQFFNDAASEPADKQP